MAARNTVDPDFAEFSQISPFFPVEEPSTNGCSGFLQHLQVRGSDCMDQVNMAPTIRIPLCTWARLASVLLFWCHPDSVWSSFCIATQALNNVHFDYNSVCEPCRRVLHAVCWPIFPPAKHPCVCAPWFSAVECLSFAPALWSIQIVSCTCTICWHFTCWVIFSVQIFSFEYDGLVV